MNQSLKNDKDHIEDVCSETAGRYKYIYYLALAVYDILNWIERHERKHEKE